MRLDEDVLSYFQQRAVAAGAESCQSYLNRALRRLMESERNAADTRAPVKQQLLADRQFIGALAAEVAAQTERRSAA